MQTEPIRLAQPSDGVAVVACVRAAYASYVKRIGREPAPMNADYVDLIKQGVVYTVQDAAGLYAVLVVKQEGGAFWVNNVAVRPDYQKRGVGRRLVVFAEQCARERGLSEVWLYTNELMFANIALYQRLGFREVERREHQGFRRVFMRKLLSDAEVRIGD